MFSGQGSQYFQMGKELYASHPVFRRTVEQGDALVGQQLGRSLKAEIYGRPRHQLFDEIRFSHPALLVIQYAVYQTLVSEGIEPALVWGSSLGELIAAVAADAWSFESALAVVMEQARLVEAHCPPGGMLAILGDTALYDQLRDRGHAIALAGVNFKTHFTISADNGTLERVEAQLKARDVSFLRLPVRYAFHSAAIDPAKEYFVRFCSTMPMNHRLRWPFLSGTQGKYVDEITPAYFWAVVRGPMGFSETMQRLEAQGPSVFVDCGPSGTLATFAKYGLRESSASTCFAILTPFHQGIQKLAQLKEYVVRQA